MISANVIDNTILGTNNIILVQRLQAILKSAPSKAKRKELAMMQDNYGSLGLDFRLPGDQKIIFQRRRFFFWRSLPLMVWCFHKFKLELKGWNVWNLFFFAAAERKHERTHTFCQFPFKIHSLFHSLSILSRSKKKTTVNPLGFKGNTPR